MRQYFVWLVTAWGMGIVLGAVDVYWSAVGVTVLAGVFLARRASLSWPVVTAGALLLLVSFVYGQQARTELAASACSMEAGNISMAGAVERAWKEFDERTQYMVRGEGGCALLVTMPVWPRYQAGDRLFLKGELERPRDLPAEYQGYSEYLERQEIAGLMLYPHVKLEERREHQGAAVLAGIRQQVGRVFLEPAGGFVRAVVLGDRGALPKDTQEQFRRAGVSHMLAISGLHISLVAALLLLGVSRLPLPHWARVFVLLGILWGYVWLVGAPISAVRAGWFWTLYAAARAGGWLISWPTVLLVTAVGLVSWNPLVVLEAGFQLSFLAVAGIALVLMLGDAVDMHTWGWGKVLGGWWLVAVGAAVATWPITGAVFGEVAAAGLLANVLVVPLLPVFVVLSLGALLASSVFFELGLVIAWAAVGVWFVMDTLIGLAARLPGGFVEIEWPWVVVPVWYAVWIVVAHIVLWIQERTWRTIWE